MPQPTLDQTFQIAVEHHLAGQLPQAEAIYKEILARQPQHVGALHYLGVIAHQSGRHNQAADLIRQALTLQPNNSEACNNLGSVLEKQGQLPDAIAAYRKAITLKPDCVEAHNNLGNALRDVGRPNDAIAACRQAIAIRANFAEAFTNLGAALADIDQFDEAISAHRQAINLNPNLPEAYNNLGHVLEQKSQFDQAIAAYRQAISLRPTFAAPHNNLGNVLREKGQLDQAIASYRQSIAIDPNYSQTYSNLSTALADNGQFIEARNACLKAIELNPKSPDAYNNLGNALRGNAQPDEAVAAYRKAIDQNPNYAKAHNNLGNALKDQGQLDQALSAYRQATALQPSYHDAHSNLVYTMCFHPGYDARAIANELAVWNHQHAQPLKSFIQPHADNRDPDRRLRIGYVSPDFCDHVVGRNLLPLLREHNHQQFEVFCYANAVHADPLTNQFRRHADIWRSLVGLSDSQAADLIRQDRIDILVDVTLHMAHNRLLLFARKPAPVQVTFAGYPGSTGLETINYRLTDPYLDPPGLANDCYSETSICLPDSFWCYDPIIAEPDVNALPAPTNGYVTFGCLNNFCKVNEPTLQLWAQLLKTVDRSRLMMLCPVGSHRQPLLDMMQRHGIHQDRIELVASSPRRQYLERYHRIDIGLDTFPYNGHTTSLDSFWMGVPVITLVGHTVVGRAGLSQLTNLGLLELVAQTEQQYLQIATELAADLPKLAELRRTLRPRMQASPLMDAPRFTRNIESAYRRMWQTWCETSAPHS